MGEASTRRVKLRGTRWSTQLRGAAERPAPHDREPDEEGISAHLCLREVAVAVHRVDELKLVHAGRRQLSADVLATCGGPSQRHDPVGGDGGVACRECKLSLQGGVPCALWVRTLCTPGYPRAPQAKLTRWER